MNLFIINDRVVFQIIEQYEGTDTSTNYKLYEYLLDREETIFLIDIENKFIE